MKKDVAPMLEYRYFPPHYSGPIRTLFLDANITSRLDTIVRKGSSFKDPALRQRMADLITRLDKDVWVMPGLGAAERVLRRNTQQWDLSDSRRQSENARRLLVEDQAALRAWLEGGYVHLSMHPVEDDEGVERATDEDARIVYEELVMPSYAMVLKAYQLHLDKRQNAVGSLRRLSGFAEEIFARGSREMILGVLLLTGTSKGREMALNIMKLHQEQDAESTLNRLWNTSFDLTYSRVATQSLLPELRNIIPQPAVFATDDKHLGDFLDRVQPQGAIPHSRGGGLTADLVRLDQLIEDDFGNEVIKILQRSTAEAVQDTTDVKQVRRIRRHKSMKYIESLEQWFIERYY